jgi:hypothetical protein
MAVALRSLVAAGALILILAAPAAASGPERFRDGSDFEFTFAECASFDIVGTGWFELSDAVFTASDGTQRIIEQFHWEYTLTRSDLGTVVGTGGGRSVLLAPLDGTPASTYAGVRTDERYVDGSRVAEIGRIVFDTAGDPVFIAGPHPFETTGVDRCAHVQP